MVAHFNNMFSSPQNTLKYYADSSSIIGLFYLLLHSHTTCTHITADLAVDWINDKLYWTVRKGKIEEMDLETKERRIVIEADKAAAFNGITVYPYPDYG